MARFLLVHGAAHGAWCWRDVIPALAARGHQAEAIDLPSHGADETPLADVTLDLYASAILAALETPSIVVGHSMGGFPITRAATLDPELMTALVYLCAWMPAPRQSLANMRRSQPDQPLLSAFRINSDGMSMHFDPEQAEEKFFHDCPPGTLDYALPRLGHQAIKPMETPLSARDCAPPVPQHYIVCSEDRAIPPAAQRQMAETLPEPHRHTLKSAHSPFFAVPEALADILNSIAQKA